MSIRNKRLIKEIPRLEDYNLIWDDDWQTKEPAVITTTRHNILISLTLKHNYPFHYPILRVHNLEPGIEYITWFLKQNKTFKKMKNELNIVLPCICCYSITCYWTPNLGIKDMIEEFDAHYKIYNSLVNLQLIYNKIAGFDNLIYQRISKFLY